MSGTERKRLETVGPLFRSARQNMGLSINQVVQYLNDAFDYTVSPTTVYGWENGVSHMNVTEFVFLCELYDITDITVFLNGNSSKDSGRKPSPQAEAFYERYRNSEFKIAVRRLLYDE